MRTSSQNFYLIALALSCLLVYVARGQVIDISTLGSQCSGCTTVEKIRYAVYTLGQSGGGTVLIPSATTAYDLTAVSFQTVADAADPNASSLVYIATPNITISGGASGSVPAAGTDPCAVTSGNWPSRGTILSAGNNRTLAVFCVAPSAYNFRLEKLAIDRNGKPSSSETNAVGVLFAGSNGNSGWLNDVKLEDVKIRRQYDGIASRRRTHNGNPIICRPQIISLRNVLIEQNQNRGMDMSDWGELQIESSFFFCNGYDGLYLRQSGSVSSEGVFENMSGTAKISTTQFYNNGTLDTAGSSAGLRVKGIASSNNTSQVLDIHVAASQFDKNLAHGISIVNARDVVFSGCVVSANASTCETGSCYRYGAYIADSEGISLSAMTFNGNRGSGLVLISNTGVSASALTFIANNSIDGPNGGPAPGTAFALVLDGGEGISMSGVTFVTGVTQTYGIWRANDPLDIFLTGITFSEGGVSTVFTSSSNVFNATGRLSYWNPKIQDIVDLPASN